MKNSSIIMMKLVFPSMFVLFVSSCSKVEPPKQTGQEKTPAAKTDEQARDQPAGLVAEVNGVPISREDFEATLAHAQQTLAIAADDAKHGELRERILQKMIQDELLVQHARSLGLSVSSEEVNYRMESIKAAGGGEAAFEGFLNATKMSPERVRSNVERNLLLERLMERIRAQQNISDEQVAEYYRANQAREADSEKLKLAHILFIEKENEKKPLERAAAVRAEIDSGLTFEKAVMSYSDDSSSKELAGSLGLVDPDDLLPVFVSALKSLKPGDVSKPVESPQGVHLLRLSERIPGKAKPLADVRKQIARKLLDLSIEKEMKELGARLGKEGKVKLLGQ